MKDDPVIEGGATGVMNAMRRLNPEFGCFDLPHWKSVRACSFGIKDGKRGVWVSFDGTWRAGGHMQWFDTLEDLDAWLLVCWRMR